MVKLDIIKKSKIYLGISFIAVIIALAMLMSKGLNYGIDFTGGNLFQLKFEKIHTLKDINIYLDKVAEKNPQLASKSRKVQLSEDNTIIIRTPEMSEGQKTEFLDEMSKMGKFSTEKTEKVGSSIGKDLKKSAIYSLIIGGILIALYITIRFEWKFALGAIITLAHDVIITLGIISFLGYEINSDFIAAVLTILGYSINDTIIIYDRIREKLKSKARLEKSFGEILNISINDVLVRSVNTSLTTLLAAIAIFIFGGDSLKTFIVTLILGVSVGSYSSIFLATPLVYLMDKDRDGRGSVEFKEEDENYKEKIVV